MPSPSWFRVHLHTTSDGPSIRGLEGTLMEMERGGVGASQDEEECEGKATGRGLKLRGQLWLVDQRRRPERCVSLVSVLSMHLLSHVVDTSVTGHCCKGSTTRRRVVQRLVEEVHFFLPSDTRGITKTLGYLAHSPGFLLGSSLISLHAVPCFDSHSTCFVRSRSKFYALTREQSLCVCLSPIHNFHP